MIDPLFSAFEPPTEPPTWTPPPEQPPPRRSRVPVILAITTVLALLAAVLGWTQWRDARSDADDRTAEVAALQERVDRLERQTPDSEADASTPGDESDGGVLEDLLGGGDNGSLDDLLGGLGGSTACMTEGLDDILGGGGGAGIPTDDPRAQYDAVAAWVAEERDLSFDQVPEPTFVSADEMQRRVREQVAADYPADVARDDEELLAALGAIEPGTDLRSQYSEFVGGQVAGYYDPDTGELVVLGDDDEPFDGAELTTIAHELEHALADQNLTLPDDDNAHSNDPDGQLAALALVEGDASLTMSRFQLRALDVSELLGQLGTGEIGEQQQALLDAPPYLVEELLFPYLYGQSFVCALYTGGGWAAVDAAYADWPATTAQIMFPDRYAAHEAAVDVPDPTPPGGTGWTRVRQMTFGAAQLMFVLESAGVDGPQDRAAAWAGGEISQWRHTDGDTAVQIVLAQREGSDGLCDSVRAWTETLDSTSVACANNQVSVALGG